MPVCTYVCRAVKEREAVELAHERAARSERLQKQKLQEKLDREAQKKREAAVWSVLCNVCND